MLYYIVVTFQAYLLKGLSTDYAICSTFSVEMYRYIVHGNNIL